MDAVSVDDSESLARLLRAARIHGPRPGTEADAIREIRRLADAADDRDRLLEALRDPRRRCGTHAAVRFALIEIFDDHCVDVAGLNAPDSPDEEKS